MKRRASKAVSGDENRGRLYFHTRRVSSVTTAIVIFRYPNPFCDSLRSLQREMKANPPDDILLGVRQNINGVIIPLRR